MREEVGNEDVVIILCVCGLCDIFEGGTLALVYLESTSMVRPSLNALKDCASGGAHAQCAVCCTMGVFQRGLLLRACVRSMQHTDSAHLFRVVSLLIQERTETECLFPRLSSLSVPSCLPLLRCV